MYKIQQTIATNSGESIYHKIISCTPNGCQRSNNPEILAHSVDLQLRLFRLLISQNRKKRLKSICGRDKNESKQKGYEECIQVDLLFLCLVYKIK